MNKFPQLGQQLFVSNGHYKEYAHIPHPWEDMNAHFYRYIAGYKDAADTLIQQSLEKKDNYTLDTFVFPACFLYRQYLELALKDIYLSNVKDSERGKIKTIDECQHDLCKIWSKVKPLILADFPNDDKDVLEAVENYIKQFAAED